VTKVTCPSVFKRVTGVFINIRHPLCSVIAGLLELGLHPYLGMDE
jgi:hypothetical protein